MNLNNLHKHIPSKIYERGEEYYEYDSINNVEHDYPDTWTAEVEGSDLYSVEIKLNGDDIISWKCDCPYDHGDICKHIVAVLLYVKDHKDKHPVSIEISPSPAQEQLTEILKQTDNKELTSFLSQYADKHPDFYLALTSNLHPKKKASTPVDYAKEIQNCFNVRNSYNRYNYYEGRDIAYRLGDYIEKAKSLIKLNCHEEALSILLHIIKKIGTDYEDYYDDESDLGDVCQEAVNIVIKMIETGLSNNLLKILTDEVSQMIKNSNYENYSLADLNQILFSISLKTSNFEKGIAIIDAALKAEPDSFRTFSLVTSKIELLEHAGKREEVENVISSYLYLPEIRKIKLKELLSKKQYEKALCTIDEGIIVAEKKNHSGTVSDWKDEKLSVYQLLKNNDKVIQSAEDLFINGRDSMKYYHILKNVIPSEKWTDYLDKFLSKAKKQQRWGIPGHVLIQIYIVEEYWDKLMDYVEKNIQLGKYNSLGEYESYLKPRYPERMLALYHKQITDYAKKNMGRDHYRYVADVLKTMKQYPGGNELASTLLVHFKSVYSNRRAMMEELGGLQ